MKHGITGFLLVAAALAMAAPARADDGGLPGTAGDWTGVNAAQPQQIAVRCTCRRKGYIAVGRTTKRGCTKLCNRMNGCVFWRWRALSSQRKKPRPRGYCFICPTGKGRCVSGTGQPGGIEIGPGNKRKPPRKDRLCKKPEWLNMRWRHDVNCKPGGGWRRYGTKRGRCFYCPPKWGWRVIRNKGYYEDMICKRVVKKPC